MMKNRPAIIQVLREATAPLPTRVVLNRCAEQGRIIDDWIGAQILSELVSEGLVRQTTIRRTPETSFRVKAWEWLPTMQDAAEAVDGEWIDIETDDE